MKPLSTYCRLIATGALIDLATSIRSTWSGYKWRTSRRALGIIQTVGIVLSLAQVTVHATESWQAALSTMPLPTTTHHLNRTNCVGLMLNAFRPDSFVKALIFMPGATDEFYLYKRASALLTNVSPSLLDAVTALTNQTRIRVTFRPPLVLLHTPEDSTEPGITIQDERTANRLKTEHTIHHLLCDDRDWDFLQPILRWSLKMDVRPWRNSTDSWHFYRHNLAGWNLTGWEALEATALAGKTGITIRNKSVIFQLDQ